MFEIEPFYEEIIKVTFRVSFIVLELFERTRSQFHYDDGFISKKLKNSKNSKQFLRNLNLRR